jgi:uncharacterized membrane protein YhhN
MKAELWWLVIPAATAVVATSTDYLPFKMGVPLLCATIIAALALGGRVQAGTAWWVIAAFAASAIGDYFLSNKRGEESFFVIGIGLYLVAHLGYLVAAWRDGGVNVPVLALALGVFLAYYAVLLRPAISEPVLSGAVLVYLVVSCIVLGVAAGLEWRGLTKALFVTGISLIVLSDFAISMNEFLGVPTLNPLILPTYYLAHLSITASLIVR